MTFKEFKTIAAHKSQVEDCCVYFIRAYSIEGFTVLFKNGTTKCVQSIMGFATDLAKAQRMIRKSYDPFYPYYHLFTIDACKVGVLVDYTLLYTATLQSWSVNNNAQIIEHGMIRGKFYGKSKRNKHFKKGTQVGVLDSDNLTVELGVITQIPPSVKEVWEFREGVRLHYKEIGVRFSESAWQYNDNCPKDFYRVMVNDKEINVLSSRLIPLTY